MTDLLIYIIEVIVGYQIGCRLRARDRVISFLGNLQIIAIMIMLFTMGLRMGSNEEVTNNLGSIGLVSALMTVIIMTFSAFFAFLTRKMIGMNRWAIMTNDGKASFNFGSAETVCDTVHQTSKSCDTDKNNGKPQEKQDSSQKIPSVMIVVSVVVGLLCGYFFVSRIFGSNMDAFDNYTGILINIGLFLLLVIIGINMGIDESVIKNFRNVGARIIIFPFIVMIGALVGGALCSVLFSISMKDAAAVTVGFGWYSLAPNIILEAGLVKCAAISFMYCVMREYFSLLLVPIVAKRIGYMEAIGICGATAMGVNLPIVERATRGDVAIYSFISGIIHTASVPILLPLILSL